MSIDDLYNAILELAQHINPTVYGTVALLEIVWFFVNLASAVFSVWNWIEASLDLSAVLRDDKGDPRPDIDPRNELVARGNRRAEAVLGAYQAAVLAIAVLSMAIAPPVRDDTANLSAFTIIVVFISGSLLFSYLSFTNRSDRVNLRRLNRGKRVLHSVRSVLVRRKGRR